MGTPRKDKPTNAKVTGKKETAEKKESSAFKRRWPIGTDKTAAELKEFRKLFPKADKLPTRMEVIRAGIKAEFSAQSLSDVMETIFENNEWGPREVDSARRREFRNIENPKEKNPRGRPGLTDEEKAAKEKEKAEKAEKAKIAKEEKKAEKEKTKIAKAERAKIAKAEKEEKAKKAKAEKEEKEKAE